MTTVYLMGAGASHGYRGSRTGVTPPLAGNFFSTFYRLLISQDLEVKIGFIVTYLRDTRGIPFEELPDKFEENVEIVFAELHEDMHRRIEAGQPAIEFFHLSKAYDQFVFWFAHVINEIQCGECCTLYKRLVELADPGATFVTFNWDTLMDRVLAETGRWYPDDGYGVEFAEIMDRGWRAPRRTESEYCYLKLHGSTNWLGPYGTLHFQTSKRTFVSSADRIGLKWCVVDAADWYPAYKDRWRPGYTPFSYFFPPDDPAIRTPLMPIIVPPTGRKDFAEFADVFQPLWHRAHEQVAAASKLVVLGYSFPRTDSHAFSLVESFCDGPGSKQIDIVDPYPDGILERLTERVQKRARISVVAATLAEYVGVDQPEAPAESEYDRLDELLAQRPELDPRQGYLLDMLSAINLEQGRFDLTTHSGLRLLDCTIPGELATHLFTAYRPEVFEHRITHIPIAPRDGQVREVTLSDIWIVLPLPAGGVSAEMFDEINMADADRVDPLTGLTLRQMVENSYHCEDPNEVDQFVRRVLAAQSA